MREEQKWEEVENYFIFIILWLILWNDAIIYIALHTNETIRITLTPFNYVNTF